MTTCIPLLYLPKGNYDLTTSNDLVTDGTAAFNTEKITHAAVDITFTSLNGGTAPTCTIFLERQGLDGNWYQVFSTGALNSGPQTISVDVSPALNGSVSGPLTSTVQHNVFTKTARLRWAFGGTTPPTSVTFSASIVGRD